MPGIFPTRLSRRHVILVGALLLAPRVWAAAPANGRLRFGVLRNGRRIGEHEMTFTRTGASLLVVTEVSMVVRVGPVAVLRYGHQAREEWREGRFLALDTSSSTNGKREQVAARRMDGGVSIETRSGRRMAPAESAPLTHWNPEVFGDALFNPQTGRNLKVVVGRHADERVPPGAGQGSATRWTLRGEAEIDNWYDEDGVWSALRGRLPDKSVMEYRQA